MAINQEIEYLREKYKCKNVCGGVSISSSRWVEACYAMTPASTAQRLVLIDPPSYEVERNEYQQVADMVTQGSQSAGVRYVVIWYPPRLLIAMTSESDVHYAQSYTWQK